MKDLGPRGRWRGPGYEGPEDGATLLTCAHHAVCPSSYKLPLGTGGMESPWADTKGMVTTAKHPLPAYLPHMSIYNILGWWEPKTSSSTRSKSTGPVTLRSRNRF